MPRRARAGLHDPMAVILLPLVALAVALTGCAARKDDRSGAPPPLVLLLSIDTLRQDRLGCYGCARETSPNIDALARESIVFTAACAQATQTLISHKSIFTSRYPLELIGETTNADMDALGRVDDQRRFLVSALRQVSIEPAMNALRRAGFLCAAFTDGSWIRRFYGFNGGFGEFDDRGGHFAAIAPRVLAWLEQKGDYPAFLFVHAYDVHCPYTCREPYNSAFCTDHSAHVSLENRCANRLGDPPLFRLDLGAADYRAIGDHYDGGVLSADAYVGEILDKLRDLGMYDDALIVLLSDHGESLGEAERIGHGGLHLEELLVPLMVKPPRSAGLAPALIDEPVELIDVMPTMFDLCGARPPGEFRGRSLRPLMEGGTIAPLAGLVAQTTFSEGRREISNARKRAILVPGRELLIEDLATGEREYFDLARDGGGVEPVAEPPGGRIAALLEALAACDLEGGSGPFTEPEPVSMDEQTKKELEALGYIGD